MLILTTDDVLHDVLMCIIGRVRKREGDLHITTLDLRKGAEEGKEGGF